MVSNCGGEVTAILLVDVGSLLTVGIEGLIIFRVLSGGQNV